MQYRIKLSTKQQSETKNSFENSDLKSITYFLVKNITFLQYSKKLRHFVIKMILILSILPILGSAYFSQKLIDKNKMFLEMKILQWI